MPHSRCVRCYPSRCIRSLSNSFARLRSHSAQSELLVACVCCKVRASGGGIGLPLPFSTYGQVKTAVHWRLVGQRGKWEQAKGQVGLEEEDVLAEAEVLGRLVRWVESDKRI